MTDIVYCLGHGSRWQNNELRYSLRSLSQYLWNMGDVWVIGEKPDWLTNVNYLPYKEGNNASQNIKGKLELACKTKAITDNFLFVNDDHFLLSDFNAELFPYYYNRTIAEVIQGRASSFYGKICINAQNELKRRGKQTKYFDTHFPILYNKKRFLDHVCSADWKGFGNLIKSLYANSCDIEGVQMIDCKSHNRPLESWKCFSTMPNMSDGVKDYLLRKFTKPSNFELTKL
jgi:hypothetical protein